MIQCVVRKLKNHYEPLIVQTRLCATLNQDKSIHSFNLNLESFKISMLRYNNKYKQHNQVSKTSEGNNKI